MTMVDLIVVRLADMQRVHPDQITARCSQCNAKVAVFPSGQRLMQQHGDALKLFCSVCKSPGEHATLAPGAEFEPFQSVKKRGHHDNRGRQPAGKNHRLH
jgi:hypothetical protein